MFEYAGSSLFTYRMRVSFSAADDDDVACTPPEDTALLHPLAVLEAAVATVALYC